MAIQNADAIQKLYVAYFNRPADYYGLQYWDSVVTAANGDTSAVAAAFASSQEYKDTYAGMDLRNTINAIYKNLFGHSADIPGLDFWTNAVQSNSMSLSNAVTQIAKGAQGTDKVAYESKVAAATAFTNALDTTDEILGYSGAKANAAAKLFIAGVTDAASLASAITPVNLDASVGTVIGAGAVAQTFQLTKGLDNVMGTAGNDLIVASIDAANGGNVELNTLSSVDIINGGAGIDTLQIQHASGAVTLGNLSNVEIVQIESAATGGVTVDSSKTAGVTNLNVTKAAGVVDLTAGAATDVALTAREGDTKVALAHQIDGGKNVTVNLSEMGSANFGAADTITIGAEMAAKGNVVVNVVGKAYDADVGNVNMGAIRVTGGSTITVNQTASSNTAAADADASASTVYQGVVIATTNAATSTVTVKQTANVDAVNGEAAEVGGVTETASFKFGALKNGDRIVLNGLTFTAKADMTGAEVAAAFSNLVKNTLPVKDKDSQSAGAYTKGTYSGEFDATKWTSGAANGDTVVFTSVKKNANVADLDTLMTFTAGAGNSTKAPTYTTVQGAATTEGAISGGVMGVQAGVVFINANTADALKTVTVDGYSMTNSGIFNAGSTKLDTVNLLNGGNFAIQAAAETLALNLTAIGVAETDDDPAVLASLDLSAASTKTFNVTSNGDNYANLNLGSASAAASLNVAGDGMLTATGSNLGTVKAIKVSGSAGLDLGTTVRTGVTSVDTTGTTGDTTIAINGTTTYAGGAGADIVTVANANTAISKSIDLGAGDDTLFLTGGTIAVPTVDLKGGEGRDTLKMSAANAVALSANATFAGKIDGFEVLSIDKATTSGTINLANLDNINYVISENSSGSTATKATFTATLTGGLTAGDTVTFDGKTTTVSATDLTASQLALQLAGLSYTNWVVKSVAGSVITFEAANAGQLAVPANTAFTINDADASSDAAIATSGTAGVNAGASAALTINNLANGGTLELTAGGSGATVSIKDAATGTADVLNIVAKAAGLGVVTATNVETVNINAAAASDLTVKGNTSLTAINVTGSKALTLVVDPANTKLASVNAADATGALTVNLSAHNGVAVTVTGGSGNDVLTASAGANAHADILKGGAGADILVAGSNGARLTGGEGNDMFVLSTGTKEANTYSIVTDFTAGDLLQLKAAGGASVSAFAKLSAELNESTSVFSNFVDAAIAQAAIGEAVWFSFGGNSYVVIDNGSAGISTFENGVDSIIQLAGVTTLDNTSFNIFHGTVGLI